MSNCRNAIVTVAASSDLDYERALSYGDSGKETMDRR